MLSAAEPAKHTAAPAPDAANELRSAHESLRLTPPQEEEASATSPGGASPPSSPARSPRSAHNSQALTRSPTEMFLETNVGEAEMVPKEHFQMLEGRRQVQRNLPLMDPVRMRLDEIEGRFRRSGKFLDGDHSHSDFMVALDGWLADDHQAFVDASGWGDTEVMRAFRVEISRRLDAIRLRALRKFEKQERQMNEAGVFSAEENQTRVRSLLKCYTKNLKDAVPALRSELLQEYQQRGLIHPNDLKFHVPSRHTPEGRRLLISQVALDSIGRPGASPIPVVHRERSNTT